MNIDAVARNLVTDHSESEWLVDAFTQHGDFDGGAFGTFQQIGHIAGAHVVSGFAVNGDDDIARADAGAIGRSAGKGRNHNDFIISRPDLHAHAVIFTALLLAQGGIGLRVEKVGVRVKYAQHAGDGAVIDGLVGIDLLGVVLLDDAIDVAERAQAVANVVVVGRGRGR